MRPWQFSKPKDPGFGISRGYYLSILASSAVLPAIREIANPGGEGGAAPGFGVPLLNQTDKALLAQPMQLGAYAIASPDRKTVLRLTIIGRDEAGFDPEAFARSPIALGKSPELLARIRATWTVCQLTFESHDASVYPALDFVLFIGARLATLCDGVVGDAICQRYLLPEQVFSARRATARLKVYAEEHIAVKARSTPAGLHVHTLGMQKFALPEFEIQNLHDDDLNSATTCLFWLAQQVLEGTPVREGFEVGGKQTPLEVRDGGFDRALWEGIPVYELLPPTSVTATDAVQNWARELIA